MLIQILVGKGREIIDLNSQPPKQVTLSPIGLTCYISKVSCENVVFQHTSSSDSRKGIKVNVQTMDQSVTWVKECAQFAVHSKAWRVQRVPAATPRRFPDDWYLG